MPLSRLLAAISSFHAARRRARSSTRRCISSASGVHPRRPSISCRSDGPGIADDADVNRIDLADLLRIDVDLNEARRGNRKRVLGPPRAAVRLAERRADRHDDVGVTHRLVGHAGAPDAGHPARERMIFGERALRHQRRRDGHRHQFGERLQFAGRLGDDHAVAGEDRRLPARIAAAARRRQCRRARPRAGRNSGGGSTSPALGASMCCENTSIGMSSSTAPGRPVCARLSARGMTSTRNFASSTRHTRLQIGR